MGSGSVVLAWSVCLAARVLSLTPGQMPTIVCPMNIFLAFLAGFLGGLVAVGVVVFFLFRKLKADPMYQSMKGMQAMMGGMPPGMEPRGFKKYS